jgi:hypothetical protein
MKRKDIEKFCSDSCYSFNKQRKEAGEKKPVVAKRMIAKRINKLYYIQDNSRNI